MPELRDTGDRFEMDEQGLTTYADYRLQADRLYIDYVFAPVPLRGTGASDRLMKAIGAEAKARGLKIVPICGYAGTWLRRSHDFRDLLA